MEVLEEKASVGSRTVREPYAMAPTMPEGIVTREKGTEGAPGCARCASD